MTEMQGSTPCRVLCALGTLSACLGLFLLAGCTSYIQGSRSLASEDYAGAASAYRDSIEAGERTWQARVRLGYALYKQDRPAEALAEYETVLAEYPHNPYALLYAGLAHVYMGQAEEALDHLERFDADKLYINRAVREMTAKMDGAPDLANPDFALQFEKAVFRATARQEVEDRYYKYRSTLFADGPNPQPWMREYKPYLP